MDFGSRSNIADLSLYQNGRVDRLEDLNCLFGLAHVFLQRQRGEVEDDRIEPGFCCGYGVRQGVGMICVEKDGKIELFPQASYQSRYLTDSDELAFALRHPNQYGDVHLLCGGEYGFQLDRICDIEVTDCRSALLCPL